MHTGYVPVFSVVKHKHAPICDHTTTRSTILAPQCTSPLLFPVRASFIYAYERTRM